MADQTNLLPRPAAGYRSGEVGSFLLQMDDQSRRLLEAARDLTAEELEWQPALGMNSIGMLLAHLAIAEVFWTEAGVLAMSKFDVRPVLGLGEDDDGMPLEPGGSVPANLRRKQLPYFEDLLARARAHLKEAAAPLTDADLEREVTRTRPDGSRRVVNIRWVLYHLLEHYSGHSGQILLLRHLYRATVPQGAK